MMQGIDKEWEAFITSQSSSNDARMLPILYQSSNVSSSYTPNLPKYSLNASVQSCELGESDKSEEEDNHVEFDEENEDMFGITLDKIEPFDDTMFDVEIDKKKIPEKMPECSSLHISTKTNVLYLNQPVDIANVFWNIPCIEYWRPMNGVIKKQMKVVSNSLEEFAAYQEKLKGIKYYTETCVKQKNNPNARKLKFKDDRKITVGISKKDIMNCRSKPKGAFYNCFAIILRIRVDNVFREIHVKIFNTGKLEVPGILDLSMLNVVKTMVIQCIQPFVEKKLEFEEVNSTVLINSNFKCGFHLNLKKLYSILRNNYKIETAYEPSHYPGIKCKFYVNSHNELVTNSQSGIISQTDKKMTLEELHTSNKYKKISFMLFRTGSGLILGNCPDEVIYFVFEYIKTILEKEFQEIYMANEGEVEKDKKTKTRKKNIQVSNNYMSSLMSIH